MSQTKIYPITMAVVAAALFGASAPLTKILLVDVEPMPLAAFLYLGSGLGLLLFQTGSCLGRRRVYCEASLEKKDFPWLLGAVFFGGVAAPIILMFSLQSTPASTASLLLNFEGVSTAVIAIIFFRENAGRTVVAAIIMITAGSILLSWDFSNTWGISLGAVGILTACMCWGIDNNFTGKISSRNPYSIVTVKGLGAGSCSLLLSLLAGCHIPLLLPMLLAMLVGFFCYGLSIVLFVFAMRSLGSARTSAFFGMAPFIGAVLSFVLLQELPSVMLMLALPLMIGGAVLLLREKHTHRHLHPSTEHEHRHDHCDGHHDHEHPDSTLENSQSHCHLHAHEECEHEHGHYPDTHHKHGH